MWQCTERKTRTIPDEGDCPIFEESLEFYIHHPEMALIRFIVLDQVDLYGVKSKFLVKHVPFWPVLEHSERIM